MSGGRGGGPGGDRKHGRDDETPAESGEPGAKRARYDYGEAAAPAVADNTAGDVSMGEGGGAEESEASDDAMSDVGDPEAGAAGPALVAGEAARDGNDDSDDDDASDASDAAGPTLAVSMDGGEEPREAATAGRLKGKAPGAASDANGTADSVSPTELIILMLDVDQGECQVILERTVPSGGREPEVLNCMIIDGGRMVRGAGYIERVLRTFLPPGGLINYIVVTHYDADHVEGVIGWLRRPKRSFRVGCLLTHDDVTVGAEAVKISLLNAASGVEAFQAAQGGPLSLHRDGHLRVRVLPHGADPSDNNSNSIALLIEFGEFRYFTAGDLPSAFEDALRADIGQITALKCGHHGASTSTSPEFLNDCKPKLTLISCGMHSYGHPSFELVRRLCEAESVRGIYATFCVHNRVCLNPNYLADEEEIVRKINTKFSNICEGLGSLPSWINYDGDNIFVVTEELEGARDPIADFVARQDRSKAAQLRKLDELVRAVEKANEHYKFATQERERALPAGYVAGGQTLFGTIGMTVCSRSSGLVGVFFAEGDAAAPRPHIDFHDLREEPVAVDDREVSRITAIYRAMRDAPHPLYHIVSDAAEAGSPDEAAASAAAAADDEALAVPAAAFAAAVVADAWPGSPIPQSPVTFRTEALKRFGGRELFSKPTMKGFGEGRSTVQTCEYCDDRDFTTLCCEEQHWESAVNLHEECWQEFADKLAWNIDRLQQSRDCKAVNRRSASRYRAYLSALSYRDLAIEPGAPEAVLPTLLCATCLEIGFPTAAALLLALNDAHAL